MSQPDKKFAEFIAKHHVLTLCTVEDNKPWVASCFYTYLPETNQFIFTSDLKTRHGAEAAANKQVAINIHLETDVVGKIEGLQMAGEAIQPEGDAHKAIKKAYIKAFPYAAMAKLSLWVFTPNEMKLTNNKLFGLGKKLNWKAE